MKFKSFLFLVSLFAFFATSAPAQSKGNFSTVVNVKNFGASGSPVRTTGAIRSGSTSLTVASAASFAVNQGVFVEGAGTQGSGNDLVARITSIYGATITLNAPAAATVSAANVQHDDTDAINAATASLFANGGGGGTVDIPAGFYRVNKGFDQTRTDARPAIGIYPVDPGHPVNAILFCPYFNETNSLKYWRLRGEFRTGTIWNAKATEGTIISTDLSGVDNYNLGQLQPSLISTRGLVGTVPWEPGFNHVNLVVERMHLRVPDNPTITAINGANAINMTVEDVSVETNSHPNNLTVPPTNPSVGIYCPKIANAARIRIKDVNIIGVNTAIKFSEHVVFDDVFIYRVLTALHVEAGGYPNTGKISIEHCRQYMVWVGQSPVNLELSIERAQAGHWWSQDDGTKDLSATDSRFPHGIIRYIISHQGGGDPYSASSTMTTQNILPQYLQLQNIFQPMQTQKY
ncbi:MAG TPA: hypothetical protein VK400_01255 [Pyrinomonadaceae bacterium]|nr:hypothetical protein [Pyrinomonadaceae bacterium]